MTPLVKSFYAQWQSKHGRQAELTPVTILRGTMALGFVFMFLQFSIFGREPTDAMDRYGQSKVEDGANVYPDFVLKSSYAEPVSKQDLLHLALLHEACLTYKDHVIPHTYGQGGKVATPSTIISRDDPDLISKIRQCPDVDIFLPQGIRGHGYCEDAVGYTKYLESRMLPMWAVEMTYEDKKTGETFSYHDLCPTTPMIFLNHYWDGIHDKPEWPLSKTKILMPNIEMSEVTPALLWSVDAVLCKTAICARRIRAWYQQEGNPKDTVVFLTRHTTSDVATLARERLGNTAIRRKDYSDTRFVHVAGNSWQKGTRHVLECWLSRPDFPPLDVYIDEQLYRGDLLSARRWGTTLQNGGENDIKNIKFHFEKLDTSEFGKMMAENAFFLCTSYQEGYGHYINQVRAASAFILTTDLPPMNELVSPESGLLIPVTRKAIPKQLLGGRYEKDNGLEGVEGISATIRHERICAGVEQIMAMPEHERRARAERAKVQYDIDTRFFAAKMKEVRAFARQRSRQNALHPRV